MNKYYKTYIRINTPSYYNRYGCGWDNQEQKEQFEKAVQELINKLGYKLEEKSTCRYRYGKNTDIYFHPQEISGIIDAVELGRLLMYIDNGLVLIYNTDINKNNHTPNEREVKEMKKDINTIMKELAEMTAMLEETSAIVESLKDEVKAYMTEQGVDEVVTENGEKATWREVISNRFDSTAFKKSEWGELYKEFTKPTKSKRFTFNA